MTYNPEKEKGKRQTEISRKEMSRHPSMTFLLLMIYNEIYNQIFTVHKELLMSSFHPLQLRLL